MHNPGKADRRGVGQMLAGKAEPPRQIAAVLAEQYVLHHGKFGLRGSAKLLQQIKSAAGKSQQRPMNSSIHFIQPTAISA
jgi:hypothetical protein